MTTPTSLPALPSVTRAGGPGGAAASGSDDGAPVFASALDDALTGTRPTPGRGTERAADRSAGHGEDHAADRAAERASDRAVERASDRSAVQGEDRTTDRPGRPADDAGPTPDPTDPAAPTAADGAAATVVVQPGLWALLAAATPATSAPVSTQAAPTAVTGPVTGSPVAPGAGHPVPAADQLPAAGAPTGPETTTPSLPLPAGTPTGSATTAAAPAPAPAPTAPTLADLAATGLTVVLDPAAVPAVDAAPAGPSAADVPPATPADQLAGVAPTAPGDAPDTGSDATAGDPGPGAAPAVDPVPSTGTGIDTLIDTLAAAGTAPTAPAAVPTPVSDAAPAAPDTPVAQQLGRQFAVLRNAPDGSSTMTVVITPESLGPVTVAVTVTGGSLDLTLHGAHTAGRHALQEALPQLRRELEGAGLTFSRLEVDTTGRDPGSSLRDGQQQLLDARAGQPGADGRPGRQEPRARAWAPAADPLVEGSAAPAPDLSTSPGVDVRV